MGRYNSKASSTGSAQACSANNKTCGGFSTYAGKGASIIDI